MITYFQIRFIVELLLTKAVYIISEELALNTYREAAQSRFPVNKK